MKESDREKALKTKLEQLFSALQTKKKKRSEIVTELVKMGPSALNFLEASLEDKRDSVALAALEALCSLKAFVSVPKIFALLKRDTIRSEVRKNLEKLIGKKLPLASDDVIVSNAYSLRLKEWWKKVSVELVEQLDGEVNSLISQLAKAKNAAERTKIEAKILAMGASIRRILEENLADSRQNVVNRLIVILCKLNDARSISGMLKEMKEAGADKKYLLLVGIRSLASPYHKTMKSKWWKEDPKTAKDWAEAYSQLASWWDTFQKTKLLEKQISEKAKKYLGELRKSSKPEELVGKLTFQDSSLIPFVIALLKDKKEKTKLRVVALDILKKLKQHIVVSDLLPLVVSEKDVAVQKKVKEVISSLARREVPAAGKDIWNPEIAKLSKWWNQNQASFGSMEESTIRHLLMKLAETSSSAKIQQKLKDAGLVIGSAVKNALQSPDDRLRLGAVKASSLLNIPIKEEVASKLLRDFNLPIRYAMMHHLELSLGKKLPVQIDEKEEQNWQTKIKAWQAKWARKQVEKLEQLELAQFMKDVKPVFDKTEILSKEQLAIAKKALSYLKSNRVYVRSRAFKFINKLSGDALSFAIAGTEAERAENLEEIKKWFQEELTRLEKEEKDIQTELKELDKKWLSKDKPAGLISYEQGTDLKDFIYNTMKDDRNVHPLVLKKYLEILRKHGVSIVGMADLRSTHFTDMEKFVTKLKAANDPVSEYLKEILDEKTKALLKLHKPKSLDKDLAKSLIQCLNLIFKTKVLYEEERFAKVNLGETLKLLAKQDLYANDYALVNRLLLERAYPNSLKQTKIRQYVPSTNYVARRKVLTRIEGNITEIQLQLQSSLKKLFAEEKKLAKAFALTSIQQKSDLSLARQLIDALFSIHHSVRQRASVVLTRLAGEENTYKESSPQAAKIKAVSNLEEWLAEQKQTLSKKRADYVQEVKKALVLLSKMKEVDDQMLLKGAFALQALRDLDKNLRAEVVKTFQALTAKEAKIYHGKSSETPKALIAKWSKWLTDKHVVVRELQDVRSLADKVASFGKATTNQQIMDVKSLVAALKKSSMPVRKIAFAQLVDYAKKYASKEALKTLPLDEKLLGKDVYTPWKKWFDAEIKSLLAKDQEKIKNIQTLMAKLPKGQILSLDHCKVVSQVFEKLNDSSSRVREEALEALQKISKKEYGFQSERKAADQPVASASWKWWLTRTKRPFYKEAVKSLVLNSKWTKIELLSKLPILVDGLGDYSARTRKVTFTSLTNYVSKYAAAEVREGFGYDPFAPLKIRNRCLIDWKKWLEAKVKPLMTRLQKVRALAKQTKVKEKIQFEAVSNLLKALQDTNVSVRAEALNGLLPLSRGNDYGFKPEIDPAAQKKALELWTKWLTDAKAKK